MKKKYDSTIARIAGNILGHLLTNGDSARDCSNVAYARGVSTVTVSIENSVALARRIIEEVERTEPEQEA